MKIRTCDVAVIGAGSAGLSARNAALAAGAKVMLIEHGPGGTTCARVGCMPSKLLLAAGAAAHGLRAAHRFGLGRSVFFQVDGTSVMRRVQRERDHFVASVLQTTERLGDDEMLRGAARFETPTRLCVGEDFAVEARAVVIASGSSSRVPPPLAGLRHRLLTNETLFELESLPRSLAVVGAGPLGLEIAQAMARLDVRVAVFSQGRQLGGLKDPAVAEVACDIFSDLLDLRLGTEILGCEETGPGVALRWRDSSGIDHLEEFEYVLSASGRKPNLECLDLSKSGLSLDEKGIPEFDPTTMRCGKSAIFIAGDVDADRPVLHEASAEGRIAGRNAARYPNVEPEARTARLGIVFSDPNIAIVGVSFQEASAGPLVIGEARYEDQGRAKVFLQNAGLVRVYATLEGRLLGAEMVAPAGEHSAHLLAWSVQQKLTVHEVLAFPFYHPSFEEGLRTALRDLSANVSAGRSIEVAPGN